MFKGHACPILRVSWISIRNLSYIQKENSSRNSEENTSVREILF